MDTHRYRRRPARHAGGPRAADGENVTMWKDEFPDDEMHDMSRADEPVLRPDTPELQESGDSEEQALRDSEEQALAQRIRRLVTTQPYGVLATQGEGQAYGSLVAFAFSEDLREAFFATQVATRKYQLLTENERIALVVDDRPEHVGRMMDVEAITITGRAREVPPGPDRVRYAEKVVARHPQLRSFVAAESSALFRIQVTRFFHVSRFQEVRQWVPGPG